MKKVKILICKNCKKKFRPDKFHPNNRLFCCAKCNQTYQRYTCYCVDCGKKKTFSHPNRKKEYRCFKCAHLKRRNSDGYTTSTGYRMLYSGTRKNGCVPEHRVILEKALKRKLKEEEIVHHIDFNKSNNNLKNLVILTSSENIGAIQTIRPLIPWLIGLGIIEFNRKDKKYIFSKDFINNHNAASCKKCFDIIESKSEHDFVRCSCGEIFVDGGLSWARRGANDFKNFKELIEYEDNKKYGNKKNA